MTLYLPLLLATAFALLAPPLSRRLPPHVSTWLLSAGALLAAAASSASLALLAFTGLAQNPLLAAQAHWSDEVLHHHNPVAVPIGTAACAATLILGYRFSVAFYRRVEAVREAHALASALGSATGELAVLDSPQRQAFAVPGRPGRIAVTTGLLRSLDGAQRRALLAHERSHLNHHHHLHHSLVHLAVSVNPLLNSLRPAVELATERWADEDAAHVCRRGTVAAAVTQAATGTRPATPAVVLAAGYTEVSARITALSAPAPRLIAWQILLPAAVLTAAAITVAIAMRDTEQLFELAQHAYRAGQR
ncbi:MAG: M48 family metalloprotease [Jatrophihabitantaceae bacterium]